MALYKDKLLQRSVVKNQRIWYKLITQINKYYRRRGRAGRYLASTGIEYRNTLKKLTKYYEKNKHGKNNNRNLAIKCNL